jgi:hypothetical protein
VVQGLKARMPFLGGYADFPSETSGRALTQRHPNDQSLMALLYDEGSCITSREKRARRLPRAGVNPQALLRRDSAKTGNMPAALAHASGANRSRRTVDFLSRNMDDGRRFLRAEC